MSKIKIIEPGFFSTIQDVGRIGYRHKGVPLSGPMDKKAFEFAHKLVGNDYQKCLIETTLKGPTLLIEGKVKLAYSGAPMDVYLNEDKMLIKGFFSFRKRFILLSCYKKKDYRKGGQLFY